MSHITWETNDYEKDFCLDYVDTKKMKIRLLSFLPETDQHSECAIRGLPTYLLPFYRILKVCKV